MSDDDLEMDDGLEERVKPLFKPWMIAAALISVALFAGIVWFAYRSPAITEGPAPVIKADSGKARVKPKEEGGLKVADRDKLVLQSKKPAEPPAGGLRPADEKPLEAVPEAAAPAAPPPAAVEPPPPLPGLSKAPQVAPEGDQFLVQLGAYRSEEGARAGWDTVAIRHGDLLGGFDSDIQRADLGARGVFYRLRAGPLFSREEGDRLCQQLKARGVGCLVLKR